MLIELVVDKERTSSFYVSVGYIARDGTLHLKTFDVLKITNKEADALNRLLKGKEQFTRGHVKNLKFNELLDLNYDMQNALSPKNQSKLYEIIALIKQAQHNPEFTDKSQFVSGRMKVDSRNPLHKVIKNPIPTKKIDTKKFDQEIKESDEEIRRHFSKV